MDNKRVLLAVVLSLAVLIGWNLLFPPVPPVHQKQIKNATTRQSQNSVSTTVHSQSYAQTKSENVFKFNPARGQKITIETPLYRAVFNSQGGILEHFILKKYKQSIEPDAPNIDLITPEALHKGLLGIVWNKIPTWIKAEWSTNGGDKHLAPGQSHTLSFVGRLGNLELHRQLTFYGDSYQIKETLQLINLTSSPVQGEFSFIISSPGLSKENNRYNRTRIAYFNKDGLHEESDKDDLKPGLKIEPPVQWGAITSNYFLLSLIPGATDMTFKAKLEKNIYRLALSQNIQIAANIPAQISCTYYLGPKDEKCLSKAPGNLQAAIHYGWFIVLSGIVTIVAVLGLGRFSLGMLLPSMGSDLGLGYSRMGFIGTGNFSGYLLGVLLSRKLVKRFDYRLVINSGIFLVGLSMIIVGRANGFWLQVRADLNGDGRVGVWGIDTRCPRAHPLMDD
jgi:YidC/Oxa1 family membrane protein insertase